MPPHEVLYSIDCCSSRIALIVMTPSNDCPNDDEEEEAVDHIPRCIEPCHVSTSSNAMPDVNHDMPPAVKEAIPRMPSDEYHDDHACTIEEQTESNDASSDPTREAWARLRESSILLGQVLDEKTGFSRLWCGYVQPSLEESRSKLQRLDKEHQLLKTTAESLTKGTEYITQTLSRKENRNRNECPVQKEGESSTTPTGCGADSIIQSNVGDTETHSNGHLLPNCIVNHRMEVLSNIDEEETLCSQTSNDHTMETSSETLSQDGTSEFPSPESFVNQDGSTLEKASIKIEQPMKRRQNKREQARFKPSSSRDPERRGGTNV
jgi:hypothetical protein